MPDSFMRGSAIDSLSMSGFRQQSGLTAEDIRFSFEEYAR
ncbi:hypothetical protein L579_4307 [Pantoea sp. AS-PWVM4]|nr:hypothetical protein L579_4307 [Pantoea sp. AS-PWVM4]